MTDNLLLSLEHVSVAYGGLRVVDDVAFSVAPGEIVGIAGESGSGKSTVCRAVMGLLPSSAEVSGKIRLGHRSLQDLTPQDWQRIRGPEIGMIFQNPASHLDPLRPIGQQIARPMMRHLGLSNADAAARAIALLNDVGINDPQRCAASYPHELSGGMKQRALIAAAIACAPKLLVADEPTTALDVTVQAKILALLKSLNRDRNLAIVLVSHDLGVLAEICTRLVIMRNGTVVEAGPTHEVINAPKAEYTQLLLQSQPGRRQIGSVGKDPDGTSPPLLRVRDLKVSFAQKGGLTGLFGGARRHENLALDGVSIAVEHGEAVGIVGESGSGKTTLARSIVRQNMPAAGHVEILGQHVSDLAGKELAAFRRRVQMVFQNPYDSLNPRLTVLESVAEPIWRHGLMSRSAAVIEAGRILESVELPTALHRRKPRNLSGGQCQRVGIARALALKPQLLIADEITSALDVTTQAQILDLLVRLQRERDLSLLYISHDLAVVSALCQRVYVLKGGKLIEAGQAREVLTNPREPYTRELVASQCHLPAAPVSLTPHMQLGK